MHHPISRSRRKALELLVQLARAKQGEHHELVEVRTSALDADLLAHRRVTAVAAHDIVGRDGLAPSAALARNGHAHAGFILFDRLCHETKAACDTRQSGHALPHHHLGLILRQPLVALEVILSHDVTAALDVPELVHQVVVGSDLADWVAARHDARVAELLIVGPVADSRVLKATRRRHLRPLVIQILLALRQQIPPGSGQ